MADLMSIKEELVIRLRNADIIPISTRSVTTLSESFNGTGAAFSFTLTNNTVKNIRSVTVGGSPEYWYDDYTVNYSTGVVTFLSAPPLGTGNVVIVYDYGATDRIFPDYPQAWLKQNSFPRIAVDLVSGSSTEHALGAESVWTEFTTTIICYDKSETNVENLVTKTRDFLRANKKSFHNFPFITPTNTGPIIVSPFGENKILQRNQDARIRFIYET